MDKLSSLVELMLENNTFLARRLAMLEEGSTIEAASMLDTSTNMSPAGPKSTILGGLAAASLWNDQLSVAFQGSTQSQSQVQTVLEQAQFEEILQHSRPYRKALGMPDERLSFISAGDRTGTWSVLSGLSLSQISSLTIIALPIYSHDITNADAYSFGIAETGRTMNEILNIQLGVERLRASRRRLKALHAQLPGSADAYSISCQAAELSSLTLQSYERLRNRLELLERGTAKESLSVEIYDVGRSLARAVDLYAEVDDQWLEKLQEYIANLYRNVRPDANQAEIEMVISPQHFGKPIFSHAVSIDANFRKTDRQ